MPNNRLHFETLLCDLSASLINLPSNKVDQVIEQWLERSCEFLAADRAGLHQFSKDGKNLTLTHSFVAPGFAPLEKMTANEIFPWSTRQIRKGRVILFKHIPDDIPAHAQNEKQFFVKVGSKSFVAVPLKVGGVVLGGLTFGTIRAYTPWTAGVVKRLKLMGEVFANALMRKQIEEELKESEERFKRAFEHAAVGMSIFSTRGRFMEVNDIFAGFLGYTRDELLRRSVIDVTHMEDREISQKRIDQALGGAIKFFWLEKRYLHRDGHPVWGYVSSALLKDNAGKPLYFVSHIQDITEKKTMGKVLNQTNTALKVVLNNVESEKIQQQEKILANLENLVFPYLHKLNSTPLDREQRTFVELIESNLVEIAAPFAGKLSSLPYKLTQTEMAVADLIRRGKASKEVAAVLQMSVPAVFFHRNNIRKKLGLRKTGTNLSVFLRSLP